MEGLPGTADSINSGPHEMSLFELDRVGKEYHQPGKNVVALDELSLKIESGQLVSINGESGSGKTTLLTLLAGMDSPTRGAIRFLDTELNRATPNEMTTIRLRHMGFVFQDFLLMRHLSVIENVRLPLLLAGGSAASSLPEQLLERVGLGHRLRHRPNALSRGEMQRVAVARALVNRPRVLFADEPTANLDRRNSEIVSGLLRELHGDGLTVIVATHNPELIRDPDVVFVLDDGKIASE